MKRLLLVVVLLALAVTSVSASSYDFSTSGDVNSIQIYKIGASSGTAGWVTSATGGNQYISIHHGQANNGADQRTFFISKTASPTTYAASTLLGDSYNVWSRGISVVLLDSTYGVIAEYPSSSNPADTTRPGLGRYEVIVSGGAAKLYKNGSEVYNFGAIRTTPSYVGFGVHGWDRLGDETTYWDDYVTSNSDTGYVIGNPDTYEYDPYWVFLKKDVASPAASGLALGSTYAILSSYNMTTTFAKNNANTETMYLRHTGTGEIVGTETVSGYYGSVAWPLQNDVFDKITSAAPYGSYTAYLSGSPSTLADPIQYLSTGAYVAFDKTVYSYNDPFGWNWNIDASHWDPATYSYKIELIDTYGVTKSTTTVTGQVGSTSGGTWPTTYDTGVYYGALIATDHSGNDYWLWVSSATLMSYLRFTGYVNDGETGRPIPISNVTIMQGTVYSVSNTIDGNYSTSAAFGSGMQITFNVTAPGHEQYWYNTTPIATKTITKNITLWSTSPTYTGVQLHGIVADSDYARPLAYVPVTIENSTYGETHSVTTNVAGAYMCDDTRGGPLVSGRYYQINATLARYTQTSPTQLKLVVGA